nr:hypothetical protein [Paraburkholderia bannensis]
MEFEDPVEFLDQRAGTLRYRCVGPAQQGGLSKFNRASLYQRAQRGIRATAPEQLHSVCTDHGAYDRFRSGRKRRHCFDQAQMPSAYIRRGESFDTVDVGFETFHGQINAKEHKPYAFIKRIVAGKGDCGVCHSIFLEAEVRWFRRNSDPEVATAESAGISLASIQKSLTESRSVEHVGPERLSITGSVLREMPAPVSPHPPTGVAD